jgi:hypothetical protein
MSRRRINVDIVFDDNDPSDIHPAHIVASVRKHLRATGHPALKTAEVEFKKELTA